MTAGTAAEAVAGPLDLRSSICHVQRVSGRRMRTMGYDVDLMRDLLFELEGRQTSPRSTVIICVDDEAVALGRPSRDIEASLAGLLDLDYIDGPGPETSGVFLFRKLTRKGRFFIRLTQRPRDWERLKVAFAHRTFQPEP